MNHRIISIKGLSTLSRQNQRSEFSLAVPPGHCDTCRDAMVIDIFPCYTGAQHALAVKIMNCTRCRVNAKIYLALKFKVLWNNIILISHSLVPL